jgi:hypothetical protein
VAIPSTLRAFFSPPANLRTIGSVIVSVGPWADTLDSLCADPDAPIDVKPEPPIEAPRRHYRQLKVVKHVARSPLSSESSDKAA